MKNNPEEPMSKQDKERAIKKLEIAIDKLIDLQDMGLGDNTTKTCLELLNAKLSALL
jgi:hypothetical protein